MECTLVILTCDAYRDLLPACLTLHRRYWPDCAYPTVLVGETATVDGDGDAGAGRRSLLAGPGLTWSQVALYGLARVETEYVLLMLEDYFLTAAVASEAIEARRTELVRLGGAYLRLGSRPRPTGAVPGFPHLGEHERGFRFRTSLQPAFWRRDVLLELLRPEESPWQFERNAARRSDDIPAPFFSTRARALPFIEALRGGRWYPRAIRLCRREGLNVNIAARRVLSTRQRLAWVTLHLRLALTGPTSLRLRRAFSLGPAGRPGNPGSRRRP